jgi:hypothetical protein
VKIINGFYVDGNNNLFAVEKYTEQNAIKASKSLIKCHDCINCYNCNNCIGCINCKDCIDCTNLFNTISLKGVKMSKTNVVFRKLLKSIKDRG